MKKTDKLSRNILTLFFISMLMGIFFLCVVNVAYQAIKKYSGLVEYSMPYNGEKDYPFDTEVGTNFTKNKITSILCIFQVIKLRITKYSTEFLPGKIKGVLLKKRIDKLLGFDFVNSQGIKTDDMIVPFEEDSLARVFRKNDNSRALASVIEFAKKMESEGRNFLVFENPEKHKNFFAYYDYSDENRLTINKQFRENNINYFDVEDYMNKNLIDYKTIFFKTDNHWKPSAGLWADRILCEYLNEKFSYKIDVSFFDTDKYDITVSKKSFLGSLGKIVTEVYAKKEDFEIIIPKYDSDITVFNSAYSEERRGTINNTLFNTMATEEKNIYRRNCYEFYSYGDTAIISSHNNQLNDGSSLLVIKLSFADVMVPFLTQVLEDVFVVDLRHFTGSLMKFIQEKNPQTIVMIYPTELFRDEVTGTPHRNSMFNFD